MVVHRFHSLPFVCFRAFLWPNIPWVLGGNDGSVALQSSVSFQDGLNRVDLWRENPCGFGVGRPVHKRFIDLI